MLCAFFFFFVFLKNYWTKHEIFLNVLNKVTCDCYTQCRYYKFPTENPFFPTVQKFQKY